MSVLVIKYRFEQHNLIYVQVLLSLPQCPIIQIWPFILLNSLIQNCLNLKIPQFWFRAKTLQIKSFTRPKMNWHQRKWIDCYGYSSSAFRSLFCSRDWWILGSLSYWLMFCLNIHRFVSIDVCRSFLSQFQTFVCDPTVHLIQRTINLIHRARSFKTKLIS